MFECDDAITDTVGSDEVFESAAWLYEIEEVFKGLVTFEVELRVVCPDVFADFESDEEVESCSFALDCLEGGFGRGGWW
jgi:hypothetical protein